MPTSNASRGLRPFSPTRFGRYTLLAPLATGGMAQVFLARVAGVEGFEKLVVIKKILPHLAEDEYFVDRFLDEGKIVVKLQHGSIAQVLDMGKEGEEYYIAMEFVDGKDLRKIAARCRDHQRPLPLGLTLFVFVRLLDALAYAHRKRDDQDKELNLVHRDVSPQNLIVSYEGEVKIIDFGLAKSAQSLTRTSPSVILGKFFYMSPEQARHLPADRRSDLYAAAICLWESLAGQNPFDAVPPGEILRAVANPSIPRLKDACPAVPDAVDQVVMRALRPDPAERFQTAEEMRGRLMAAMLEADPTAGPESLAAFMRECFAREYDNERKTIAFLSKLPLPERSPEPGEEALEPSGPSTDRNLAAALPPPGSGFEPTDNTERDITASEPTLQGIDRPDSPTPTPTPTPTGPATPVFGGAAESPPARRVTRPGVRALSGEPDPKRPGGRRDPLEFVPGEAPPRGGGRPEATLDKRSTLRVDPAELAAEAARLAKPGRRSGSRPAMTPEQLERQPASIVIARNLASPVPQIDLAPPAAAASAADTPAPSPAPEIEGDPVEPESSVVVNLDLIAQAEESAAHADPPTDEHDASSEGQPTPAEGMPQSSDEALHEPEPGPPTPLGVDTSPLPPAHSHRMTVVLVAVGVVCILAAVAIGLFVFRPAWFGRGPSVEPTRTVRPRPAEAGEASATPSPASPTPTSATSPSPGPAVLAGRAPARTVDESVLAAEPTPPYAKRSRLSRAELERLAAEAESRFADLCARFPSDRFARLAAAQRILKERHPLVEDPASHAEAEAWLRWFSKGITDTRRRLEASSH